MMCRDVRGKRLVVLWQLIVVTHLTVQKGGQPHATPAGAQQPTHEADVFSLSAASIDALLPAAITETQSDQ